MGILVNISFEADILMGVTQFLTLVNISSAADILMGVTQRLTLLRTLAQQRLILSPVSAGGDSYVPRKRPINL